MPLHEGWKKGDLIPAGKWLKKMGHVSMRPEEKPRNAYALVKKGKFVLAQIVPDDQADTIVNYDKKLRGFKRITLETMVKFDEDRITVFSKEFWHKATNKNLFLGMIKKDDDENPFDTEVEEGGVFFKDPSTEENPASEEIKKQFGGKYGLGTESPEQP